MEKMAERLPFRCEEESSFFSASLCELCFSRCGGVSSILELGSGTGKPVLEALKKNSATPPVEGWEINVHACRKATAAISEANLQQRYTVHHGDFFVDANYGEKTWLISNPPYLPASNDNVPFPDLDGGRFGNSTINRLVSLRFQNVLIVVSSISDPLGTFAHISGCGYDLLDWRGTELQFGPYSSERAVLDQIIDMRRQNRAFCLKNNYRLAALLLGPTREDDLKLNALNWLTYGTPKEKLRRS